jgi:hypothetical protein
MLAIKVVLVSCLRLLIWLTNYRSYTSGMVHAKTRSELNPMQDKLSWKIIRILEWTERETLGQSRQIQQFTDGKQCC